MKGKDKSKAQLLEELALLRQNPSIFDQTEVGHQNSGDALRETEARYRSFLDGIPVGLYRTTPDGRFLEVNSTMANMLGYPDRESLLSVTAIDLYVNPEDRPRWQVMLEKKGLVRKFEVQFCKTDGTIIWINNAARVVKCDQGKILHYQGSLEDISERKQAEEELRKYKENLEELVAERTEELTRRNLQLKQEITERQLIEMELKQARDYLENILDNSPDVIGIVDQHGRFIMRNKMATELFGYRFDELKEKTVFDLYADKTELDKMLKNLRREGSIKRYEINMLNKDKSIIPVEISISLLKDSLNHTVGSVAVVRDLSKIKQTLSKLSVAYQKLKHEIEERQWAEGSLRHSEEKSRIVLESNPDPIVVYDITGKVDYFNPAFTGVFGWTLEECLGKKMDLFVPEASWPKTKMMIDKVLAGESFSGIETSRYTKEGKGIPVSVSGAIYRDQDGKPFGSVINLRDITEQKEAEEALRRQNEYLAALHETTIGLISRLDLDDLLQGLISRAAQLFGTPNGFIDLLNDEKQELERKAGQGIFNRPSKRTQGLGEGVSGKVCEKGVCLVVDEYDDWPGRSPSFEYNVVRSLMGAPLKSGKKVMGVFGIAYGVESNRTFGDDDVQRLTRFAQLASIALDNARLYSLVQESRDFAEAANQAKSTFLANMSHELRTPLNAILGYSEMLAEDAEDLGQDKFIPDLRKIKTAGLHLLELINEVLDLSKVEAGKMELYLETFNVSNMIQQVVNTILPLANKKANSLEVNYSDNIGEMKADLTKIRQALFNLLGNACKFTEHGTISLDATRETFENAHWLVFTISDTGIGMRADQIDKLFQPFSQADASTGRNYGGTGLGLSISRKFCQMMGGDISVESEYQKGTVFTVKLPAVVVEPSKETVPSTQVRRESVYRAAGTVLAIDDDSAVRELINRFLTREGFRVETASGGEEGLQLARRLQPDVIILDVLMPVMDGWAVLKALKQDPTLSDIPVIILTIMDDNRMGFTLGASEYLTKPIDRDLLIAVLRKYIPHPSRVLVVADDAAACEMLRRMLEKDGWEVIVADNGRTALDRIADSPPDFILLDLMMPEMDGFQFVDELRKNTAVCSIPMAVITAKDPTYEERQQLCDSVQKFLLKGAYSSEELLSEVRDLVAASVGRKTKADAPPMSFDDKP
jgi:PAS domain S-box-containing protein